MSENPPLEILSLGAGVQSSTLALMAAHGEITPMPDAAIFADTQGETASVYKWLDWLEGQLPFPVHRVSKGSLKDDTLRVREKRDGSGSYVTSGVPYYRMGADGAKGLGPRQCTRDYKIRPIMRDVKAMIRETGRLGAVQWIGISLDEVARMKPSRDTGIENRWPLIDARMTRHDCKQWMDRHGYPEPPRSACEFCAYHNNHEWREMKRDDPEAFQRAVDFERDFSRLKKETGQTFDLFFHRSLVPLDQVDLSTEEDRGQMGLFDNWSEECEGMCGV